MLLLLLFFSVICMNLKGLHPCREVLHVLLSIDEKIIKKFSVYFFRSMLSLVSILYISFEHLYYTSPYAPRNGNIISSKDTSKPQHILLHISFDHLNITGIITWRIVFKSKMSNTSMRNNILLSNTSSARLFRILDLGFRSKCPSVNLSCRGREWLPWSHS